MKAPRFYDGQKVVATANCVNANGIKLHKDKIYTVITTTFCGICGDENVDIGITNPNAPDGCLCENGHEIRCGITVMVDPNVLAPIIEVKDTAFKKMTYKETVEEVEKVLETSLN